MVGAAARDVGKVGSGLYVERMVQGAVAELIVGFTRDPMFGLVMTLGSGGVLVELLRDTATLMLPASRDEVEATLRGLKLFPLLDGFRGRPRADLDAAVDAILGIAAFVLANADKVEELDVNPLIICAQGNGAWIADALMVPGRTSMADVVTTRRDGAILEVTLDRPKANAIDLQTSRLMGETFKAFATTRTACGDREDGRRQVLLSRLGSEGRGRRVTRWTATMASAALPASRSCAT